MRRPSGSVEAKLFDRGWSRVRGRVEPGSPSRSLHSAKQMVRAGVGARPAVFKLIRTGGCHSPSQLRNQIAYVTTKSAAVFDSRGLFDGERRLDHEQIEAATKLLSQHWTRGRDLKFGHTTHLLMSFPVGTRPEAVRGVAEAVCAEFFNRDGATFDYIAAIHTDRAHKHAHVIVNRRSLEGSFLTLQPDGPYSYQAFREAMVRHGDRWSLGLEATQRLHRGVLTYAPTDRDVREARAEGRKPVERERIGRDLDHAIQEVALARSTYRGLAAEASRAGFEDVSEALLNASAVLARNGVILPAKELQLAYDPHSFEALVKEFSDTTRRVEERIARATPVERPQLERQLNEVLASVAHLNPLGRESAALREEPSPIGLYSRSTLADAALNKLDSPRVASALDAALDGTGISTSEVAARLRIGAQNAALERQWIGNDARAVASQGGLDLARPADVERVIDKLDAIQARIEDVLTREGVLRAASGAGIAREASGTPAPETGRRAPVTETSGQGGELTRDNLLADVASRLRQAQPDARAFTSSSDAMAFREEVERRLDPEQVMQLRRGDANALAEVAPEGIDRLTMAKAYLQAHGEPATSPTQQAVTLAIAHAQLDRKRERLGHEHGGPTHD